jgi:hypothetical protein
MFCAYACVCMCVCEWVRCDVGVCEQCVKCVWQHLCERCEVCVRVCMYFVWIVREVGVKVWIAVC